MSYSQVTFKQHEGDDHLEYRQAMYDFCFKLVQAKPPAKIYNATTGQVGEIVGVCHDNNRVTLVSKY